MASMKAYLEKLSVSKMTSLQEKLAIPVQSNFDEIIKIIYQHKDYKIFCIVQFIVYPYFDFEYFD